MSPNRTNASSSEGNPHPLREIEDGTAWWFEGEDADLKVKHEGRIEIFPNWVMFGRDLWVPRGRVEQIHEY